MHNPQVALVTGASSGIGKATAQAFARRGIHVAAVARRLDRLESLQQSCAGLPGQIMPLRGDVTRSAEVRQAVEAAVARWGRLDILVANAGLGHRGAVVDADWQDIETVLRTNIDGVLHSIRAAVPAIRAGQQGGHIILVSSISSVAPAAYAAVYGASKSFVNGLARGLRYELAEDQIAVTTFLVGQTHSEFAGARLGRPGRVAGSLPTMPAERVARAIVDACNHRRRVVVLRWIDRVFLLASTLLPGVLDRIQRAVYR